MKKLLALLLAMVMALSCFGALAEDTQTNSISIDIPAMTATMDVNVNTEAVASLIGMFGADENAVAVAQTILPLISNLNEKFVFADGGVQMDLGLKGQNVLTLAAERTEGGFAVASNLLPSYVITLSDETIQSLVEQFIGSFKEALSSVNFEALGQKLLGYVMQYVSTCITSVTYGDPEKGEYTFENVNYTFNCKQPITIDLEAVKTGAETLVQQVKDDEDFNAFISALNALGLPIDVSTATESVTFTVPQVTVNAYTIVDEEGNSVNDVTYVTVEIADEELAVNVDVLVEGQKVTVCAAVPEQDVNMAVVIESTENGASGMATISAQGMIVSETVNVTMGETVLMESELYFMDLENPIVTETIEYAKGGERTMTVLDENKSVITVEQLMNDAEGQAIGALQADLMTNGVGQLLTKLNEIAPEQMGTIMSMLMPAPAEGAAE